MSLTPTQAFVECPHAAAAHGGVRRMAYWRWDDEACADPDTLMVCVHGLTRQGRDFDVLARAMAPHMRVVCPDVAGRGGSDWLADPLQYQVPTYVQDMLLMLAQLQPKRVLWVGTSMGGLIGMGAASLPGSPIERLVLNDVGPAITKASLLRIADYVGLPLRFDSVQAGADHMRAVAAGFGPHSEAEWLALSEPMLRRDGEAWVLHYDPQIAAPLGFLQLAEVDALLAQAEAASWAAYEAIQARTLVLRGEVSDLLTPETVALMGERGPRASSHTVQGVGHAPTLVAEDQVAVVRDFLLGP
jgi:pimeloyl-ACP methyl ester carboxylesterase